jgi:hypothetical protein
MLGFPMNVQGIYLSVEMSELAEGTQETGEFMESTSPLKTSTDPVAHCRPRFKRLSAGESRISQIGAALEGIEDSDVQDASLTMDEWRSARHSQTVPRISSNLEPTVFMPRDISITQARQ